jgi:hypothetical protein
MMSLVTFISVNGLSLVAAIEALILAALAIALIIPGDQPDKALQGAVDFIKKLSRK